MSESDKKRFSLFLRMDLYRRFKNLAHELDTDMQPLIHRAVEIGAPAVFGDASGHERAAIIAGTQAAAEQEGEAQIDPTVQRWLDVLRGILESGHVKAIRAITSNLDAFAELAKDKRGRAAGYRPADHGTMESEVRDILERRKSAKDLAG
jgi:hypothetical protein